ncbi:hypothetical protein [Novipirellula artificiosorum]|uniref:hypothetical protein n=1 Tax=Novipirellula artificiosorum TaxID=2528016 RepID=UPI0011B407D8|nr:hypothetical protein [Novipirellula artificiosorum]
MIVEDPMYVQILIHPVHVTQRPYGPTKKNSVESRQNTDDAFKIHRNDEWQLGGHGCRRMKPTDVMEGSQSAGPRMGRSERPRRAQRDESVVVSRPPVKRRMSGTLSEGDRHRW